MLRFATRALAIVFLAALGAAGAQGEISARSAVSAESATAPALTGSGAICGVVVDESGKPVAGELLVAVEAGMYDRFLGRKSEPVTAATWDLYKSIKGFRSGPAQRTDAAGRFEVKGLAGGYYVVQLLDAFVPQPAGDAVEVEESKPGQELKLTRVRKPVGSLTGRLLKPDGAPVGAMRFQASYICRRGSGIHAGSLEIMTDSEGRYYANVNESVVRTSIWTFVFAVPGYRLAEVELEGDTTKAYERDVKLTAEKADAELSGTVILPNGKPAAGVLVVPYVTDRAWPGYSPLFSGKTFFVGNSQAVETGSDGTFRFSGLRPGEYNLMAQTERRSMEFNKVVPRRPELAGCITTVLENVKVGESGRASGLELRLVMGGKITITVTDAETGQPLAGAGMFVRPPSAQDGPFGRRPKFLLTADAQGVARAVGLYPGKYDMVISAAKHQQMRLQDDSAPVLKAGQELEIKVPLQANPGETPAKPVS